jgi:CHAD domain-containing protein
MMYELTASERAILERIAREEKPVYVRRALLLLLREQGLAAKEIGPEVGLSAGRVRYWLRAFRERRMDVFPDDLLTAATLAEPVVEAEGLEISIEELCRRYDVDMAHARHVAEMALALFDLTAEVHGLSPERRDLLEKAAILHNVGRDIILEHRLAELREVEQQIVACTTAFHRKRFRPQRLEKEPSYTALPAEVQHDALAMAALIRMADGLDYSQSQTSALGEVRRSPQSVEIPVTGVYAGEDAARAQERADLWHHLFDVELRFLIEGEPVVSVQPEEGGEPEAAPPRKKAPGVLPHDAMSEAGRKVLRFHFERMLAHEPGTRLGEDIEELHDMRVATRRMRSAFRVFSPYFDPDALQPFLKGLQRTGRALGGVRDLDVFMEKAQRYLDGLPEEEQSSLDPLLANWQEQREAARAQMLEYLDGKKYQRFASDFGTFLLTEGAGALAVPADEPLPHRVCHLVPSLIYDRYRVVRGYETVIEGAAIETLHALRIDSKRLRYSLEFFREVLGPEAEDVIQEVVTVQDHLGDLHDADVACSLLVGFLDGWAKAEQRERINVSGVTRYLVAKQNELRELIESFPEAWRHFDRAEVRRKLALAVSVL